jgi:hypothetical protein
LVKLLWMCILEFDTSFNISRLLIGLLYPLCIEFWFNMSLKIKSINSEHWREMCLFKTSEIMMNLCKVVNLVVIIFCENKAIILWQARRWSISSIFLNISYEIIFYLKKWMNAIIHKRYGHPPNLIFHS